MLAKIIIKLKTQKNFRISQKMSSVFHGALMEYLDREYVEKLHEGGINPYSQYINNEDGKWYWVISVLNQDAYDNIAAVILEKNVRELYLKYHKQTIYFEHIDVVECTWRELVQECFFRNNVSGFQITIKSPMAFKENGKYVIIPSIEKMIKNLFKKFSSTLPSDYLVIDQDTIEKLIVSMNIWKYHLESTVFEVEGVRIPGFTGKMLLSVKGDEEIINLANLLFRFGEFSGMGIKSSLGMGAFIIE
jgi:CRISPR-associated endoribonuclease Cas6